MYSPHTYESKLSTMFTASRKGTWDLVLCTAQWTKHQRKQTNSCTSQDMTCGTREFQAPRISKQGCQPYATAAFGPKDISLVLISFRVWVGPRSIIVARRNQVIEKSQWSHRNRTHDLPACSAVPQPAAPQRAPGTKSPNISGKWKKNIEDK